MGSLCYVFDVDGTLVYDPNRFKGLFTIYTSRGVSEKIVLASHEAVKGECFCPETLTREIEKCIAPAQLPNRETIPAEVNDWLKRDLTVFDDCLDVLRTLKDQGAHVVLLTKGEHDFQLSKISCAELPHHESFYRRSQRG